MSVIKGGITLTDNATAVIRNIKKEQKAFRSDVEKTKSALKATWGQKWAARLDATAATKKMQQLKTKMAPLRKKIVTAVAVKDMVSSKVKAIGSKVKSVSSSLVSLGKKVIAPVVKLKDKASAGLKKLRSNLGSIIKKAVIPVTVAATMATAGVGAAVQSGMTLENQQVSMSHFVGATNKGMSQEQVKSVTDDFISQLRENANATPFETGDVIASGTRAIAIASGNTKEAMSLVKLAEDMSAASGGTKSISDSIEALADLKVGETERMKEFGFKISAEDFEKKGFAGVSAELQDFFGGAASKLANTGSGLISTIKGQLKSSVADTGLKIVAKLKPALSSIITLIDKVSPHLEKFGTSIAEKIGIGIQKASEFIPTLISGFQAVMPILSMFGSKFVGIVKLVTQNVGAIKPQIAAMAESFAPLKPKLTQLGTAIEHAMNMIVNSIGPVLQSIVSAVTSALPTVLPAMTQIVNSLTGIIGQATPLISSLVEGIGQTVAALAPVIASITNTIQTVLPAVLPVLTTIINTVTGIISQAAPIIEGMVTGIGTVISTLAPVFNQIFGAIGEKVGSVIGFIASKMGFIQEIFQTVAPIISDIFSTLWSVLSPIMDVMISIFKVIFSVVQKVWPGIQAILETVWNIIKPIIEAVGWVVNKIAGAFGWIADKLTGGGGEAGSNATGTNNWRGGPTWVGERGPELVDLPRGSRILPHKESVSLAANVSKPIVNQAVQQTQIVQAVSSDAGSVPLLTRIDGHLSAIYTLFTGRAKNTETGLPVPHVGSGSLRAGAGAVARAITLTIAKLADTIVVREDADIDKIGKAVAKEVVDAIKNMPDPQPA